MADICRTIWCLFHLHLVNPAMHKPLSRAGKENKGCWGQWLSTTTITRQPYYTYDDYVILCYDSPGSKSSWQRYWEVLRVTTTTRCLRMSSLVGIWKVMCVLEMRQYCWTTGWTVFTQRFLKYTLEREREMKGEVSEERGLLHWSCLCILFGCICLRWFSFIMKSIQSVLCERV